MKKYLILALILCFAAWSKAQDYTVESRLESYESLVNPTPLSPDDPDEWQIALNQNFNFSIFGESYPNKFVLDGGIGFINGSQTKLTGVLAYWDWLVRPDTKISYKISGTAGSKLLQIQFQNVGFYQEFDLGSQQDFMNLQIWLQEGSNKVEMHFGPSNTDVLTQNGISIQATIGLLREDASSVLGNMLQGSEENPYLVVDNTDEFSYFSGIPSDGRVFEFCPVGTCNSSSIDLTLGESVYPNPATDHLMFKSSRSSEAVGLTIWNASGQQLASLDRYIPGTPIDLSAYPNGRLLIRVEREGKYKTFAVAKMDIRP